MRAITLVMLPPLTVIQRDWGRRLAELFPALNVVVAEDEADAAIVTADAAYGTLSPERLARATRLRWLQSPQAAPPAGYYFPSLIAHPVVVTNMRGIFDDRIGVHIMAFVTAFARGLHYYLRDQAAGKWAPRPNDTGVTHLPDSTALIAGVGGIGAETARLANAFGMRVIATDARLTQAPAGVSELHPAEAFTELLPQADFVILTVPHTPATEGFMNRTLFQHMKPTAFFINIGRGMTTRLDDLVAALKAGEIAGAGLDVFEQEPLPPDHPLWSMPNVLLTPHTAAYGPHLDERRFEILRRNCQVMLHGGDLVNVVDKTMWF